VTEIRSNTVLPARREPVTLRTADGLALVGELACPDERTAGLVRAPGAGGGALATLVCLHPLPTAGGMMDSHLLRKAAARLPALAGVAVLRFNTRGTASEQGRSDGTFDGGEAERLDVAAGIEYAEFAGLPAPWLLGWSFGADLALRYGCDQSVVGAMLVSPPLKQATDADLRNWDASGKPVLALVPELDDYLRPEPARRRFAVVARAEVVGVDGARHLWVGERYVRRVLDEIVQRLAPDVAPLPTEWPAEG
jgi:alpha/beta superfamily hydrolase